MTFNLQKSNNLGSHHIAIKCQDTENHLLNEKAGVKRAGAMLRSPALLFIFAFSPSILYAIKLFEESTLSRWMILIVTGFFLMSVHIGIRAPLSRQPGGRDRTFKRWLPGLVLLLLAISLPTEVLTWRSDGKVANYWMGALITVSNFFTAIFWVGQFVRDTHIVSAPDHRSGKVRMHRTFRKRYGLTAEQANKQLKRVDRLYAFMVGLAIAIPALLTSLSQPHFYGVAYVAIIVICYAVWLGRLERLRLGTVTRALPKADLLAVGLLIVTALLLACGTGLTRAYALHSDLLLVVETLALAALGILVPGLGRISYLASSHVERDQGFIRFISGGKQYLSVDRHRHIVTMEPDFAPRRKEAIYLEVIDTARDLTTIELHFKRCARSRNSGYMYQYAVVYEGSVFDIQGVERPLLKTLYGLFVWFSGFGRRRGDPPLGCEVRALSKNHLKIYLPDSRNTELTVFGLDL